MRKKIVQIVLLCCFVIGPVLAQKANESVMSFIGVGDMMLGTHFPSESYLPPDDDPWSLLKQTTAVLNTGDVVFGNLEGAFLDKGSVFKRCKDTTKCYAFKTPVRYAPVLKKAGFKVLNIANNHIRDFGPAGLASTKKALTDLDIPFAGLIDKPYDTLRVNGKLIGLCGFSPNTGTVKIGDIPNAQAIVRALKEKCDFVIVSFHGGAEGKEHQHVTRKDEIFYGENRGNVYEFAHAVIDAGADVVFGHGPHVPRSVEVYRDRFIAYSLGNFCTYSRFSLTGANKLTPIIQVWTNDKGEFVRGQIHAFHQIKGAGTFPDPEKSVIYKIKDLTYYDFPEMRDQLVIDDSGEMFIPFRWKMTPKNIELPEVVINTNSISK